MSKCTFKTKRTQNMGGRLMINEQATTHQLRLHQIYSRPCTLKFSSGTTIKRNKQLNKQQLYETIQHERNIRHLFNFLSQPKKIANRYKDPNDFFVYPALFFRQDKQTKKLTKKAKKHQRQKTQLIFSEESQRQKKYGISVGLVSQHLPFITQFSQEQIEQYADSITRLIFNYNLNSPERLSYLKECVKKSIPRSYPKDFVEIVEEIFSEIGQSLEVARV